MIHPIRHFITITKHRHKVIWYCFKVGIGFQGLFHDLSKYSIIEFFNGAKYYTGICSPHAMERKEKGYSLAWMHHKGRNKHHFEYWIDALESNSHAYVRMPIRYVKEGLCDRIAATKIYLKKSYTDASVLSYFEVRQDASKMHAETAKILTIWLNWVKDLGIKKALNKVKKIKTYEDMEVFYENRLA